MKRRLIILIMTIGVVFGVTAQTKAIRVLLANHPYAETLKPLIAEYEAKTGVKVNVESYDENQLTQKLTTEFATRSSTVDVFMTRPLQEGKLFYRNGWYENLTPYINNAKKTPANYNFADYSKSAVDAVTYAKSVYTIPLVTEWQVLYYRTDLFNQAGLKPPTTFDELLAAAKKLHNPDKNIYGIVSRGQRGAAVTQFSTYLYNFGGDFLKNGKAVIDSPEAIEAFKFYGKMLKEYGPPGVTNMSWAQGQALFQAGQVAMWTDASVFLGNLKDPTKSQVADKVGVALMPAGPKGNHPFIVVSWGMAVSKQSKNKDLAYDFLMWATSKELAIKAMIDKGITMARNSVWTDANILAKFDQQLATTAVKMGPIGTPYDRPLMTAVGEARDAIGDVIVLAIETGGTGDIATAAKNAAKKVNELLDAAGELGK
ncbi:ABC transporter substrate-binding protein [Gracilinema caldarium]|uniref:Extracellular solute-binding protein family 1 n=1 Tax=Gracilinema caldarium (strain ATCC 51460 / DSM 7334 / H1) TaxID=744872 RepID=F8F3A4_GRAC1|nr:sugar ABC transporter substrate-binding protein [Gracilinema caldarium]AEJ20941.1 extracellular solute-binding protein family 1 [Gracilinema caldarium DSM 7334]